MIVQSASTCDSEGATETDRTANGHGLSRREIDLRRQRYEEMVRREGELEASEAHQVEEVADIQQSKDDEAWAVRSTL